jgi:hypothetical protein
VLFSAVPLRYRCISAFKSDLATSFGYVKTIYASDMYYVLGVLILIVTSASEHSSVCPPLLILSLSVSDTHTPTHAPQESNLNLGPRPLGG